MPPAPLLVGPPTQLCETGSPAGYDPSLQPGSPTRSRRIPGADLSNRPTVSTMYKQRPSVAETSPYLRRRSVSPTHLLHRSRPLPPQSPQPDPPSQLVQMDVNANYAAAVSLPLPQTDASLGWNPEQDDDDVRGGGATDDGFPVTTSTMQWKQHSFDNRITAAAEATPRPTEPAESKPLQSLQPPPMAVNWSATSEDDEKHIHSLSFSDLVHPASPTPHCPPPTLPSHSTFSRSMEVPVAPASNATGSLADFFDAYGLGEDGDNDDGGNGKPTTERLQDTFLTNLAKGSTDSLAVPAARIAIRPQSAPAPTWQRTQLQPTDGSTTATRLSWASRRIAGSSVPPLSPLVSQVKLGAEAPVSANNTMSTSSPNSHHRYEEKTMASPIRSESTIVGEKRAFYGARRMSTAAHHGSDTALSTNETPDGDLTSPVINTTTHSVSVEPATAHILASHRRREQRLVEMVCKLKAECEDRSVVQAKQEQELWAMRERFNSEHARRLHAEVRVLDLSQRLRRIEDEQESRGDSNVRAHRALEQLEIALVEARQALRLDSTDPETERRGRSQ
ncbi:hypothetical protein BC828DRAFT_391650 [Blastocladiella britannica]|nr:hypothetical protein BC828DRAFT_391650 [Blastocladiella britannica]